MLSFKHNSNSMKYIAQRHVYVINLKYKSWKTPVDFNGGSKWNLKLKKKSSRFTFKPFTMKPLIKQSYSAYCKGSWKLN